MVRSHLIPANLSIPFSSSDSMWGFNTPIGEQKMGIGEAELGRLGDSCTESGQTARDDCLGPIDLVIILERYPRCRRDVSSAIETLVAACQLSRLAYQP